jgi:PII-like signaling protein
MVMGRARVVSLGENAELLNVYIRSDELTNGRALHELIVEKVKELDRLGLVAVKVFSVPAEKDMPAGSQLVVKVLSGTSIIDQVQRLVEQLGGSIRIEREKVVDLCF